ncbi:hypothetical protein [Sphingomonas sp. MMS24-J13]|uniref:hypothetical protein n=1 Tax=Sphingomonas sp. MMS24-J13 TaxID=3238686 RepID=UPI00384CFA08
MQTFSYDRSIAPTLGVLLGLAIVETLVVHVVAVALWGWWVALALGLLDLSLVVALIGLLRAIRRHPVTIGDDGLTMRLGRRRIGPIPFDAVAGLRSSWDAAALKRKGVANLALATWPNVVIDLASPVTVRGRPVGTIAHKLDDPAAFVAALTAQMRK